LAVAEKIAKEHIKRGKLANKKELLNIATNYKKSLLESSIDEVFAADTNQVRPRHFTTFLFTHSRCVVYVVSCRMEASTWKSGRQGRSTTSPSRV
jgi:hypothetical protein